ncbi:MAG: flagellar hook-basal body complex protein, partial [Pirellulaceae bacterium]|nr:flagellar hook-basal body complex protein [Pirellulaceae bacterium]
MIKALYTAATGMQAQQTRIDVIANNLANVNTAGFKRSTASFQDLLYSHVAEAGASNADGSTRPNGLELGSGSRLVSTSKVFTPGVLERTDRELDLVISGDGFFKLQDLAGKPVYTRDGSFHVDSEGNIVNAGGLKLDPAITVESGASIAISADGTVTTQLGDRSSQAGRIGLVRFAN